MAIDTLTRNLRDGELIISDGTGTPITLTVTLDEGDLNWTETDEVVQVLDRGSITVATAHTRPGNHQACTVSFSAKWAQLVSKSVSSAAAAVLYEMLSGVSPFVTVAGAGQAFCLKYAFTVTSPGGTASEKVTFNKVYKQEVDCREGDQYNMISFRGIDFERAPTITRV